ncbi:TPA: hypothetical protein DEX28_02055 [Patescibacteria group bacterium]|nr:hypothetical protein [Patescibacteria group bacterium]
MTPARRFFRFFARSKKAGDVSRSGTAGRWGFLLTAYQKKKTAFKSDFLFGGFKGKSLRI